MRTKEYEQDPALAQSKIKDFLKGPRYYEGRHITKTIPAKKTTDEMIFGSMVHCLALEPENFDQEFTIITPDVLTKDGKRSGNAWKEFAAANADKELVFGEDVQLAKTLAERLRNHPAFPSAENMLAIEKPIYWVINGVACKGIPDIVTKTNVEFDIKTVFDMDAFLINQPTGYVMSKEAFDRGYDIQAAFYLEGCRQFYQRGFDRFILLLAETNPPYRIRVAEFSQEDIQHAMNRIVFAINGIEERTLDGDWSDPHENEIVVLEKPKWAK